MPKLHREVPAVGRLRAAVRPADRAFPAAAKPPEDPRVADRPARVRPAVQASLAVSVVSQAALAGSVEADLVEALARVAIKAPLKR